jgi:hypothetical protein
VTRPNLIPGVGGIAFAILLLLAMLIAEPPGGEYSESDISNYLDDGHHAAVIVSLYLAIAAVAGLVCLFAGLRDVIAAVQPWWARIFWASGLGAAAAFAIGWAIVLTPPGSLALGGGEAADPRTSYLITQAGWIIVLGVGGLLLGAALIVLALDSGRALPAWLRWVTLAAGVLGLASIAFLPFFALLIWGLVIGGWLLASGGRTPEPAAAAPRMD